MRHVTLLAISTLLFLCAGCQSNNHEINKSLPVVDEIIPLSCDLEQIKSSIARSRNGGQYFIPITPTDYRKKEDFLTLDHLSMRLQKYHLDKKLESVEDLYYMSGIANYITNKPKDNHDVYIHASRKGVNEIQYEFFQGIRSKEPKLAHQILDSERLEILGYLNLVTDDNQKSQAILHELERQYQKKLANKDLLQGRLIVANVEQDGRMFELIGNYTCRDEEGDCWCIVGTMHKLIIK